MSPSLPQSSSSSSSPLSRASFAPIPLQSHSEEDDANDDCWEEETATTTAATTTTTTMHTSCTTATAATLPSTTAAVTTTTTFSGLVTTPSSSSLRRRSSASFVLPTHLPYETIESLLAIDKQYGLPTLGDESDDDYNNKEEAEAGCISSSSICALLLPGLPLPLADYWNVLQRYPMFRYYLLSHICQHMGDWFVRVASLLVVERLSSSSSSSNESGSSGNGGNGGSALGHLILATMLPKAIFAQVGGFLADRYDRRMLMISMDLLGGMVVLGYLVAVQQESLSILYLVSIFRSAIGSAYYPVTTGMVPLLVPNALDLQLAVTMNGWAWSVMAILGGTLAGSATAIIGLQACYMIDCVTFFVAAGVVGWGISGNFTVQKQDSATVMMDRAAVGEQQQEEDEEHYYSSSSSSSIAKRSYIAVKQVVTYLSTCGFGALVLMKASAGFVWGPEDIIGIKFAAVHNELGDEDQQATSWRTGVLFSVIGLGTLLGPILSNLFTIGNKPMTLQRASWIGLLVMTLGWLLISDAPNFTWFLICTLIRTMGSGMVWVNSTVTLQTLVDQEFLGRVLAVEYTSYTLVEAFSACLTGKLFDAGFDKNALALMGAAFGIIVVTLWGNYHFSGRGAAQPRFNTNNSNNNSLGTTATTAQVQDKNNNNSATPNNFVCSLEMWSNTVEDSMDPEKGETTKP